MYKLNIAIFAFAFAAGPLSAQSWATRALTEEPVCKAQEASYQLCLIDDLFVAQSAALLVSNEDDVFTFTMDSGGFARAFALPKSSNARDIYRTELGPADAANLITELGALNEWDYGSFTFSNETENLPALSPYAVSLLDFGAHDVAVISWFPNRFRLADRQTLSAEQRMQHEHLLGAFRPIDGDD